MAQTQAFEAGDRHRGTRFAVQYLEKALVTYLKPLANDSQSAEAELNTTQAADHQQRCQWNQALSFHVNWQLISPLISYNTINTKQRILLFS